MSQVLPPLPFQSAPRSPVNALAVGEGSDATALAWQREMERAQMTQWFPASKTSVIVAPPPPPPQVLARTPEAPQAAFSPGFAKPEGEGRSNLSADIARMTPPTPASSADLMSSDKGESQSTQPAKPSTETQAMAFAVFSAKDSEVSSGGLGVARVTSAPVTSTLEKATLPPANVASEVLNRSTRTSMLDSFAVMRLQTAAVGAPALDATSLDVADSDPSSWNRSEKSQPAHRPGSLGALTLFENAGMAGVRCHAQWTTQGVNVWLGMDASVEEPTRQLNWIVSQLQQSLNQQGQVLARVVCNGRTVFKGDGLASGDIALNKTRHDSVNEVPSFALVAYKSLFQQE